MTESEFYETMKEKKLDVLKEIELPVHPKAKPNAERLVPFVEQIIQKHLHQPDPRIVRDQEEE